MSGSALDLWGEDFVSASQDSPAAALREQAKYLAARTHGRVYGDVSALPSRGTLVLQLDAVADPEAFRSGSPRQRRHTLLTVVQAGKPYPVTVSWGENSAEAGNVAELRDTLRRALRSPEVRIPIEALLAPLSVAD